MNTLNRLIECSFIIAALLVSIEAFVMIDRISKLHF